MKILLINQTFFPDNVATAQQVSDLATFLGNEGHEVSVICDRRAYEERTRLFPKEATWNGVSIYRTFSLGFGKKRLRYRLVDSLSFFISAAWKLLHFPSQDLVISFTSPPLVGLLGTLFCTLKGGESVQWLMDINPDVTFQVGYLKRKSVLGRILNFLLEFTLRHAKYVVVLDKWMKRTAINHGVAEDALVVVPPWSVFKEADPDLDQEIQSFKKEHGLENKFIVLFSGNHSVVHPLDSVLEAAKTMRRDPRVLFLFVGAGLRTKDVSEFKQKHDLPNIKQLPLQPRDRVKASFGSADLHCVVMGPGMSGLVHVSKIYTVLSSGKPFVFVGPEKSHIADLIAKNHIGQTVEPGKTNELVAAIKQAQSFSEDELRTIRIKSHQIVSEYAPLESLKKFNEAVIKTNEKTSVPLSYEVSVP